jgi:hypothetical protein
MPLDHISAIFHRFAGLSIEGVKSNLKSHVFTILALGVSIYIPQASGML